MNVPFRPRAVAAFCAVWIALLPVTGVQALRVMTYNILNYSSGRESNFRTILQQAQPDVVLVQEILSQTAVNNFLNNVLDVVDPGEWAAGPFVNGTDTDNALFYRPAQATFVSHFVIGTALRDIDEYTFRPASHSSADTDVRVYVAHLKASQGSTNEQKRLAEVTLMRNRMETFPAGQNYMVLGDFNIYRNTEPAYQFMTGAGNGAAGVVLDPIAREGNWHVNSAFADIHTQSTRIVGGGGAGGGMDDRFDMILVSPGLADGQGLDVLPATYQAFGQDGLHFDGAINQSPYVVVDSLTAQALHDASDHLPVLTDFQGYAILATDPSLDLGPVIVDGALSADLSVANAAVPPADDLDYSLTAPFGFSAPGGSFAIGAGAPAALHAIGMDTGSVGVMSGDLVVTTDDPDRPSQLVPLTGTVLDHARPSVDAGSVVLATALDLGTIASGDSASAPALVHNVGFGSLQALLDVYDFLLAGDPRFFLQGGFTPATVGATPGAFPVGFDGVGAPDNIYLGTLTLKTRDQQDLSGAALLADLVYNLTVTVQGGAVGVDVAEALPSRSGFVSVSPNPFGSSTDLRFGTHREGRVELAIYDIRGRVVRRLVTGLLPAGHHLRSWDGRGPGGGDLAPGIYFARLVTADATETRKLVMIR